MAIRAFDLYLDESGSFEKKGERTLIGGILVPHEQNPSMELFSSWEGEIRAAISETGAYNLDDLARGDEWHDLEQKKKWMKSLSPSESQRWAELDSAKKYVFAHCSENKASKERGIAQAWVLREYLKRLKGLGGVPVIFNNPDGVYHIDSNTTFMSIFAGGFVKLYNYFMENYPGEEIFIYVHAASRLNVTKKYEQEKHEVSPFAGKEKVLEKRLYVNQVKNYVFLNGGFELLGLESFTKPLDSFEILYDVFDKGKYLPNPATVICDYVCNSMYANKRKYIDILEEYGLLLYLAFGQNPDLSDEKIAYYKKEHGWATLLKKLVSKEFPPKMTEDFFTWMNQDNRYDQQICIDGLVDYLRPFITNREAMPLWLARLDMIMEHSSRFLPSAALLLNANMLLYKHSLLTHLGKDVSATQAAFIDCVQRIRELEQRDHLITLFCNRQIVTETDLFNYAKGHDWFDAVHQYYHNRLSNSDGLMEWFSMLSNTDEVKALSAQYGKALGSYIQLLTKEYRFASPGRQEELRKQAEESIVNALDHLADSSFREVSFAYQNACDYYAEVGDCEKAMEYLAHSLSAGQKLEDGFERQAAVVLEFCGANGEENCFIYLHYVSMMHHCFRHHDPHGDVMLQAILKSEITMDSFDHLIGDPHPGAVILRHVAASLAQVQGKRTVAQKLFDYAFSSLMNREELFQTIAISVRAEMLALGLEKKLHGAESDWQKKVNIFFNTTLPKYAARVKHNPFADVLKDVPAEDKVETLYRIADTVVY